MKINKSELFKRAWHLFKNKRFSTFGECLKQSWKTAKQIPDLEKELKVNKDYLLYYSKYLCNYNEDKSNDLFQSATLKMLESFYNFNPELSKFKTWATNVIKNVHIDLYRANKKNDVVSRSEDDTLFIDNVQCTDSTDNRVNNNELKNVLNNAMSTLCKDQCTAFRLYADGYLYKEIADTMSINIGTVKTLIQRAKITLRENVQVQNQYANIR